MLIADRGLSRLTTAGLSGDDRYLTVAISTWLRNLTLFDGTQAHGVQYASKHGTNALCWALWLRERDQGTPEREQITADDGQEIRTPSDDADLQWAADALKVKLLG